VLEALKKAGRTDLIGDGAKCLIRKSFTGGKTKTARHDKQSPSCDGRRSKNNIMRKKRK